jgi:hypothetical protein
LLSVEGVEIMIMTKEQFLKYPRKHFKKDTLYKARKAKGQKTMKRVRYYKKNCPLCKGKMHYNFTFKEWYCLRCNKFLPDIQKELWECFGGKDG